MTISIDTLSKGDTIGRGSDGRYPIDPDSARDGLRERGLDLVRRADDQLHVIDTEYAVVDDDGNFGSHMTVWFASGSLNLAQAEARGMTRVRVIRAAGLRKGDKVHRADVPTIYPVIAP